MTEVPKRDWKRKVSESNGTSFFVPEKIITKAKEWHTRRQTFEKKIQEMAKEEVETGVIMNTFFLEMRKYFEENGIKDVWTKDIGLDTEALKDGEFIVNLTEPVGNGNPFRPQ